MVRTMSNSAAPAVSSRSLDEGGRGFGFARAPRHLTEIAEIVAAATNALGRAGADRALPLEEVARWCAEVGGVDPHLERAALIQAFALVSVDALIADLAVTLRTRLLAAGPLLPSLVARGGVPRVLASLGLDDLDPPPDALLRPVPPRIARFYWQRLRAYVSWSAACGWA